MKYKAYPKYKESGVEWLGDVPTSWKVMRLKFLLYENLKYGANESADLDDPALPRYVRITDIDEFGNLRPETFRSLPKEIASPYLLDEGDLLFARSGATAGKTFLYDKNWGKCSYAGYLIRARLIKLKVQPAYVRYFTASRSYWEWINSMYIQATIQNVSAEKYADLPISIPSITEQKTVISFLDRETDKIDTLLSKKRALIEKLKEKRTALISRTVTRGLPPEAARAAGLDPHPKLKPSGVEWLGDVPEHWGIQPMKYVASVITGYAFSSDDFVDDGIPLVRIGDIKKDGNVDLSNAKHLPNEFGQVYKKVMIHDGDIVMAMTGATIGKAGRYQSDKPALLNQRVCIFRVNRSFDSGFLWYLLNSGFYIEHVLLTAFGGAQPNISDKELLDCIVTVPPFPEQSAISTYLEIETEKIDKLSEKTEFAIERLQEYRTALITAAVTGKIDVRETQA